MYCLFKYISLSSLLIIIIWIIIQKSLSDVVITNNNYKNNNINLHEDPVSIVTYNIQKFPWLFKSFKNIRIMLNKFNIILLQECFDETFESLHTLFPDYNIYRGTLKHINFMNSGLVILSKFPITNYYFHIYQNCNLNTSDCLAEKGFISVDIKINNKIIKIINTHLQSSYNCRYDEYAFLQFDELSNYVKNIKTDYVIGGDFNIDVNDLLKNRKIIDKIYYPKNNTIFVNFKNGDSKAHYSYNYTGLIYDYFISNMILVENIGTIENYYSDHLPIFLYLYF